MTAFGLIRVVLALGVVMSALPSFARAQDSARQADTARLRLLGCGTHAATLQRRDTTAEVRSALAKVSQCPEGPSIIANLWMTQNSGDTTYLRQLGRVSSIEKRPIADALLQVLSDRNRPVAARLQALGSFLQQLTTDFGPEIRFLKVGRAKLDASGLRIVGWDSVQTAQLSHVFILGAKIANVDPSFRVQVLAVIDRIRADPGEPQDMRVAASEVAWALRRP